MKYKYILFDLDGTLTDSGEGIMNSGTYALKQLGYEVPDLETLRTMVGPPLDNSFRRFGVPDELIEEAIRLYRVSYIEMGGKYQNKVYPGIEKLLSDLKEKGYKLYVATSKPEELACDILKNFKLAHYFEYIAGATLDHSRENKSDVLNYVLNMIENRGKAIMVGDTNFDVIGANKQNIPCIGVSWGYGKAEDMIEAGAVKITYTSEELYDYLTGE